MKLMQKVKRTDCKIITLSEAITMITCGLQFRRCPFASSDMESKALSGRRKNQVFGKKNRSENDDYDNDTWIVHGTGRQRTWRIRRKKAIPYLIKFAIGWGIGMGASVLLLFHVFEKNIYFMSSLFLGLTASTIPFIERKVSKSDLYPFG